MRIFAVALVVFALCFESPPRERIFAASLAAGHSAEVARLLAAARERQEMDLNLRIDVRFVSEHPEIRKLGDELRTILRSKR